MNLEWFRAYAIEYCIRTVMRLCNALVCITRLCNALGQHCISVTQCNTMQRGVTLYAFDAYYTVASIISYVLCSEELVIVIFVQLYHWEVFTLQLRSFSTYNLIKCLVRWNFHCVVLSHSIFS